MTQRRPDSGFRGWLLYLIFCFLCILAYLLLSTAWVPTGSSEEGLTSRLLLFEVPLLLVLLGLLYFPEIRSRAVRYLAPVSILLILYSLFDLFYLYLLRSPRPSDFSNIPLLFEFSPGLATGLLLYALLAPILLLLLVLLAARAGGRDFGYRLLLRGALLAIVLTTVVPDIGHLHERLFRLVEWSQEDTIRDNGRLSSFLYFGREERRNARLLQSYRNRQLDIHATLYPGKPLADRDIHIVILESFVDPRLIEGALYRPDPVSDRLKPYLLDSEWEFSHLYSPEYGGGTAQVEFELLTGIKAYEGVGTISFNVMEGGSVQSFPDLLKRHGYSTMATVATGPEYFNARQAYKSLGFDSVDFLAEKEIPVRQEGDAFVFDGDLLQYNLEKFRAYKSGHEGPVLNYVLGMYGHVPYERNLEKRPDRIDVIHPDDRIRRIANQFSYRTEALGAYLDALLEADPDAIVFVCSDHVPPILGDDIRYMFDNYRNIALFIDRGRSLEMSGREYFEIPWAIWDLLRGVDYDERNERDEKTLEALYFKALSESLRE